MSKRGCDAAAEARYDRRGAAHLLCFRVEWGLDAPVQKALRMWDKDALQDVNLQHHSWGMLQHHTGGLGVALCVHGRLPRVKHGTWLVTGL